MQLNYNKEQAFTLIEVLFALAILSIALLALTQAGLVALRTQARMQNHMQASWLADNIIAELQTGLLPLSAKQDSIAGKEFMARTEWSWHAAAGAVNAAQQRSLDITVKAPYQQGQWHFHGWMQGVPDAY